MRKLFMALLLVTLSSTVAFADYLPIMTNASSVGPSAAQWVKSKTVQDWTCDVDMTGNPTAVTVRIEGNIVGDAFDPTGMATHALTFASHSSIIKGGKATFGIADTPVTNIRANLITLSGGTSPKIDVTCGGNPQ